jgi:HSP20 family protein
MVILPDQIRRTLENLRDDIYRAVDRVMLRRRGADGADVEVLPHPAFRGLTLDVEETDDAVVVYAELPGLGPDDFRVEATPDRLILRGEKGEEYDERGRDYRRLERRYGAFLRTISLPAEVQPEQAVARYRDGVLRVTLPKSEASKARRVSIQVRTS